MSRSVDWTGWLALLDGKPHEYDHRTQVLDGFWRKGNDAIATWHDDGGLWVKVNNKERFRPKYGEAGYAESEFGFIVKNPIKHSLYRQVVEEGKAWPDQPENARAIIGHNMPDDPIEAFKVEIEKNGEIAGRVLAKPVQDDESATLCNRLARDIKDLTKRIDEQRKKEKKPHDDAAKAVQEKFNPLLDASDKLARRLLSHSEAFMLEKERKARQEAERQRQAEIAAAEAIGTEPPPEDSQPRRSRVVTGGVTVRTYKVVEFDDYEAAAAHLAKMATQNPQSVPEFINGMRTHIHRLLDGGVSVPGAKLVEKKRVQ